MKRKSSPIQARNTILVSDVADKLSAVSDVSLAKPTSRELVAAARGFASYAAYTEAIKDKTEPADFKMAQVWLVDPAVVARRINALGLANSLSPTNLVMALQRAVDELLTKFPGRLLVIARTVTDFFEGALESTIRRAITEALNPKVNARGNMIDARPKPSVVVGTWSVPKIGPLPERVGGWLRASVNGHAERFDPEDQATEETQFTARARLRRIGKQLYAGCKAEILVLNGIVANDFRPDPQSDPDALTSTVGSGNGNSDRHLEAFVLLQQLEDSQRIPTDAEVDHIIESLGDCTPKQLELIETYAAPLATRLINKKEGLFPPQGFRILEALVSLGCEHSKLSLAHALFNGWGCSKDDDRARTLVTYLLAKVRSGDLDFLEPGSFAELYSLGAKLTMQAGDRRKAFELYRQAADVGHGPSALIVSSFLLPLPAGHAVDEFAGVVEPDVKLAEQYFSLAIRAGYSPTTKQFNSREVVSMSLYELGYKDGKNAKFAPDAFDMSTYEDDYKIGFIVGFSEMESFRQAMPDGFVWSAAELAYRYGVSVRNLLQRLDLDEEDTRRFHEAYENERESDLENED